MRTSLITTLVLALVACAGCDRQQRRKEVWRFAIEETQGSVQDAYAQRFKELVEERSGGDVEVVVYPYGAIGTSDQITEQVHNGTVDFAFASPGFLGKLIPEVQVFLLHFLLSEDEEVNERVLADPEVVGMLDRMYREKGLRYLGAIPEGWMAWTTKKEVRTPEDFEGVKFRVMTSPLLLSLYEAYGASPTPLPYSEVYSALQLNMIDGQVNPVFAIQEMSFYEVTDYMAFPRHAQFITTLVSGEEFFEELSPERREMVEGIIDELNGYIFHLQQRFNRERLDTIRENRPDLVIYDLTEDEREQFRERSMPVRDQYVEMAGPRGQELLDTIEAAVQRAEAAQAAEEGSEEPAADEVSGEPGIAPQGSTQPE